jgi:putative ABC transport system permease protein
MNSLLQDLRYAARLLAKSPGFTVVAVLTLALAIGANTAIFSVANGLLLKPLPFPHADRLMQLQRRFPQGASPSVSVPKFVYWQEQNGVFESMAAYDVLGSGFNLTGDGAPERIAGTRVTSDFFAVFGARPARGRGFVAEEERPGAPRVLVLSDALWRRRFGADPRIVGRQVQLNGESYSVVGVMPASFRYPSATELWTPFSLDRTSREKANYLLVTGRLKPGVSRARAVAAMDLLRRRYSAVAGNDGNPQETIRVQPLQDFLYGRLRPVLLVALGAVGFVLLIACVNVANLQLARAAVRQREIAIRTILGARGARILRQLLTESVLLALAGGAAGLLVGAWAVRPLLALNPPGLQRLAPIGIDGTVLAFTLGLSVLAGLLFGLAPAVQAVRSDLSEPMREGSTRATGGVAGAWVRRLLVASEIALALVLVIGAALLAKSFSGLLRTDPGFAADHVLTMKLSLPEGRYGDPGALERLSRAVVERVEGLPGVQSAAFATTLPMEPGPDLPFTIEGRYAGGKSEEGVGEAQYRALSPHFFAVLRIGLARGRLFTAADGTGAPGVALINETAARRFWPQADPLGQRITMGAPMLPELADPAPRTVIGVVRDVREEGLGEAAPPIVYVPIAQVPRSVAAMFVRLLPASLVVRTDLAPGALATPVTKEVWAVDPLQPVTDVRLMEEVVSRSMGPQRFSIFLVGALALVALLLAAIGTYGVLSYLVLQRTREIGVRMALGASGRDVLSLVLRQGLVVVLVGVAIGLGGAFAATRLLASLIYGVSTLDPVAFALSPALLTAVALLATSIPARRASRLDPQVALRRD